MSNPSRRLRRHARHEAEQDEFPVNIETEDSALPAPHQSGYIHNQSSSQGNDFPPANSFQQSQNWGQWDGNGGQANPGWAMNNPWSIPSFNVPGWNPMMNNQMHQMPQMPQMPWGITPGTNPMHPNGFNGAMSNMLTASMMNNFTPQHTPQPGPAPGTEPQGAPAGSTSNLAPRKLLPYESRDAISPPSVASGGIPDPTPSYTMRASFTPIRQPTPGPLLVVIDLNGTLLHRPDRKKAHAFVPRPHAHRFISYCVETFWVVMWSSARPENVRKMCANLLSPEQLERVVAVWGRDKFGLTKDDFNKRVQCYKRLTLLWDDPVVKASHPRFGQEGGVSSWNQGNTVLIDDSAEKARSEPHNLIQIPEFVGEDETTDILPQVHDYLNELCYQSDVSTYIRSSPFKPQELEAQ